MKKKRTLLLAVVFACIFKVADAQDRLPREYVPPEELVSMNSDLELGVALDLLSEYSIQFAGKPIYDPLKTKGSIGVDIRGLPWQKALEMILSSKGLWFVESEHYLQVVEANESGAQGDIIKLEDGTQLKVGGREVKIEAIFFEGNRKSLREIGIDWSTFYNGELDLTADAIGALNMGEEYFTLDMTFPKKTFGVDIHALLKAFDSNNVGEVLAQPQIVVMEGKQGKIQVGQDFSIKTRDFAGNVIDRFFSTGTILQVTPYILNDAEKGKAIFLNIHVERSQAVPDVVSTIINKSEANSNLQLFDGEETLIAGLYSTENTMLRKGIPILKDLPWWLLGIRYIFGYEREETTQKELVIIIRASLLPDVYNRDNSEENEIQQHKYNQPDELKLRPLQSDYYSQQYSEQEARDKVRIITSSEPERKGAEKRVEQYKYDDKSDHVKELKRGIITKLQNQLALIEWEEPNVASQVVGKYLTVLRRSGDQPFKAIGKVHVIKFYNSRTVATRHSQGKTMCPELIVGDRVVANL